MAEVTPIETTVDKFLEGLDEPLAAIHELTAKTDKDFIDEQGSFKEGLRLDNYKAISTAIDAFNGAVTGSDVKEIARADLHDEVARVALNYGSYEFVRIKSWNFHKRGSYYAEPLPPMHNKVGDTKPFLIDAVDKVRQIVGWWTTDAPYFISYHTDLQAHNATSSTASVFPSHGKDNITVKESRELSSHLFNDSITARFDNGRQVSVKSHNGKVIWLDVNKGPDKFDKVLLGYEGRWAKPEEFLDNTYNDFAFYTEDGTDIVERSDLHKYAARIALNILLDGNLGKLPLVELAAPRDEFSDQVIDLLADSTVRAFLPPDYHSEVLHGGGTMTGYRVNGVRTRAMPNLVRSSTNIELYAFLKAAGASIIDLAELTDKKLGKLRMSANLGNRIDALRIQSQVDTFLNSFSLYK